LVQSAPWPEHVPGLERPWSALVCRSRSHRLVFIGPTTQEEFIISRLNSEDEKRPVSQLSREHTAPQRQKPSQHRTDRHAQKAQRGIVAVDSAPLSRVDQLGDPRLLGRPCGAYHAHLTPPKRAEKTRRRQDGRAAGERRRHRRKHDDCFVGDDKTLSPPAVTDHAGREAEGGIEKAPGG